MTVRNRNASSEGTVTIGYDRAKQECFIRGYGRMYFGDRGRKTFIEYTKENGLQVKASKFLLESGTDVGNSLSSMSSSISAMQGQISLKVGKDQLKATGIDIDSKTVKVTASQFLVQDSGGTGIAVFKR